MKKIIITVLIFSSFWATAQNTKQILKPIMGIGGIGGINLSTFSYSTDNYNYNNSLFLNPQFGLTTEFYFGKILSIRPSVLYAGRGEYINLTDTKYLLASKNIDISVPIMLTLGKNSPVSPYFYIAPVLETTYGGIIGYADISTKITKANHSAFGFGVTPALGLKFNLSKKAYFSIEGGYHLGLTNTFSDMELSQESNALNLNSYSIEGKRTNRAPVFMASFVIVINKKIKKEEEDKTNNDVIIIVDEKVEIPKDTVVVISIDTAKVVEKESYTVEEIEKDIKEGVDVTNRKITFDNIEFEFNKTELTTDSKTYLNEIIDFMQNNNKIIVQINGHTDNIGNTEDNLELSIGRAKAVFDYLLSKNIDKNRLSYKGFGDTKPIDDNNTEEGRAKNRRVEFQIISN